ncbi:MAG TPA: hypothetical protein VH796_03980 [Nitrososphaeraceae archaeon]|jgi:hypothetical protein
MAIGNQPPPTKKRIEEEKEGEIKGNIHLGLTEVIDNPSKTKALYRSNKVCKIRNTTNFTYS